MEKEQALLMLGLLLAIHAHGQQQHQCHPPRQSSLTVQHQPQQQAPQYEEHPYHCESGDQHKEQEGTLEQGADAQRGFLRDCEHDICQCLYGIPHPIPLTRLPCEELDMKGQHSARHSDQQNPVTEPCLPTWTHSTSLASHSHGDILHGQLNKAEPTTDKQQEINMSSPNTKSLTEKSYLLSQEAMVKQHPNGHHEHQDSLHLRDKNS